MLINGIDTKDISVVVQGAVDKAITPLCLASVREHLPDAEIILSTWEGTKVNGFSYDGLIENPDPGAFPCDKLQKSVMNNINRQIVSTYNGLLRCTRRYALKLRSDFYIERPDFLYYFGKYTEYDPEYRFVKERVVGCSVYSRNPRSHIYPLVMPYCPSDFFFFGLREDLLNLFDRELIDDPDEKLFFERYPEYCKYLNYREALCQYMPEQSIWIGFLKKHIQDIDCICRDHITKNNIVLTEKSFANNLVFCSADQLGIGTYKVGLFQKGIPENCLTHQDWRDIYSFYCQKDRGAFKRYLWRTRRNDIKYKLGKINKALKKPKRETPNKEVTNLKEIIPLVEEFEYVSFDIFDTLIFRRTAPDWQAVAQTSEYIAMLLSSLGICVHVSDIDYWRQNYASFSGNKNVSLGGSQEYKIRETVGSILRHYGIAEQDIENLCEQVVQNELEREKSGIFLNKDALDVLRDLHTQRKRIIAISDMYLSYQDIYSILEFVGIENFFEKIYVSSEFGKTKADGKLYQFVANDLGVEPSKILHIGDNIHSDKIMAEENGITCIHYNDKKNEERKAKLEQQVMGNMQKKYIEEALSINEYPETFCEYIQSYFSFDLINFVYDFSRKLHKEGITKAFFLERDGTLFGTIYRELSRKLLILDGLSVIECCDLKLSRKDTACLINIEEVKDVVERAYRVNPPNRFHILHILGCYGIDLSDFNDELQKDIVNHNSDTAYFEKNYRKYFYPILLKKRIAVVSYLRENGFFAAERIALIDIGWGGTSQRDIEAYLSSNFEKHICYGFYYACDDRARALIPYSSQYHYGPDLFYAYSLLEFIVKNYTCDLEALQEKCKNEPALSETYRLNFAAHVQILDDVERFANAVNQLHLTPAQIRQVTYFRLKSMIDNPPENFLTLIDAVQFSLDRKKGDSYLPLFKKIRTLEELQQQYELAQWVQASLKVSEKTIHRIVLMRQYYQKIIFNRYMPVFVKKSVRYLVRIIKKISNTL